MDSSLNPAEHTSSVASDSNYFGAEPFQPATGELTSGRTGGPHAGSAGRLWLDRMWMVIYVAFCIEVGILLTVLPWYGRVWTDNSFMMAHPMLRTLAAGNFVRGVVTGLGLVDIWLGISAAVHYREPKVNASVPPVSS